MFLFCCSQCMAQQTRKAVIIIADGIPADVIERLKPVSLMEVAGEGVYKKAYVGGHRGTYTETPSISAPGYNNMLTGTWAYKHNVWDNDNQHPNYNYPTIFRIFKTARPKADMAIFSTWVQNRKMLLGVDLPQTGNLQLNQVFDGYEKDTVNFRHDRRSWYLHLIDDYVIRAADSVIRVTAPDLSWIYLEYTDDVGHARGTKEAFDSAVYLLDAQIKRISDAIHFREKQFNEKWLLVITTDHGRDSITGRGHGGQSKRERGTWIIMNQKAAVHDLKSHEPAIVDILPTVAAFLQFTIAPEANRELDGVSLLDSISVSDPSLEITGDRIKVRWTGYQDSDTVSLFISYTNNYKTGGTDQYVLLGSAGSKTEQFETSLKDPSSHSFYKILIRGKYNEVNIWNSPAKK